MAALRNAYTQVFPPTPAFTEANIPSQSGRIFMVTGGNTGVGFEIVKILYLKGAKVYMASRSKEKAEAAIQAILALPHDTTGQINYLHLDLSDLASVKEAAQEFAQQEERLDVLWNNAAIGVGAFPAGGKTKQGHEMHIGVNCLGPFLLTELLLPQFRAAASTAPANTVRIIWTSSAVVDSSAPKGGVPMAELATPSTSQTLTYTISKAGNWLLASEFAQRHGRDGIVSLTMNPGNLNTKLLAGIPAIMRILVKPILHPPKMGSYTALWAGLSPDITVEDGGRYGIPWGRWHSAPRNDILDGLRTKEEGGTGEAAEFWTWCEEQTKEFA